MRMAKGIFKKKMSYEENFAGHPRCDEFTFWDFSKVWKQNWLHYPKW
jgi:hypothetical protein